MQNSIHERTSEAIRVQVHPLLLQSPFGTQSVLFHEVFADDRILLSSDEGDWLRAVLQIDYRPLRPVAAEYFQSLWEFNLAWARRRGLVPRSEEGNQESPDEAAQRLLFRRPSGGNSRAPILHPVPPPPVPMPWVVNVDRLEPGVVPFRVWGRKPKCFFALTKAFLGVHLMGRSASAHEVRHHLRISPPFARACGFTLPDPARGYRHTDIPGLRKLEQFDEIMASRGLWGKIRVQTIRENLARKLIPVKGQDLVEDTSHYVAFSAMDQVPAPPPATAPEADEPSPPPEGPPPATAPKSRPRTQKKNRRSARAAARAASRRRWRKTRALKRAKRPPRPVAPRAQATPAATGAKVKTKSQSRVVKACRCPNRPECHHRWELSDPGAGTVVKGGEGAKKRYWAHKAAVLSTGPDGIPLDAVAMSDAATHDSAALVPHLDRLFTTYPELAGQFANVLADCAWDDVALKQVVEERFGLNLKTPVNPRSIKPVTRDLGRGMKSLSPAGTLTCQADRELEYLGASFQRETFTYGPPRASGGQAACQTCPLRDACCRADNTAGRRVEIPFTMLPHIDPGDPPMARRFKAIMRRRTAIERAIKRIKLDFGSPALSRRGNDAFQAHLDRSLIAFHLMLRLDR